MCSDYPKLFNALRPPTSDRWRQYNAVALKSTILEFIQHDQSSSDEFFGGINPSVFQIYQEPVRKNEIHKESNTFAISLINAKTWLQMIDEKKTKFTKQGLKS